MPIRQEGVLDSPILVTDGQLRASLAVVRSLGAAGHRIHVCSSRRRSLAGASHFALREWQVSDVFSSPLNFRRDVERLVADLGVRVLLPMSEESLLELLPLKEQHPNLVMPFPDLETFQRASDKEFVLKLAGSLGIPVPAQEVLRSRAESHDFAPQGLRFPLAIKPTRSVTGSGAGRGKPPVQYAASSEELRKVFASLPETAYPILIQEKIVGQGLGVFILRWNDEIVAKFSHQRIREKPPSGGVSVLAESIPLDANATRAAVQLLEALNWTGVAMVEFKRDQRSGVAYLMEINGRFWGSLQLAVDAGADFPRLLVEHATGKSSRVIAAPRTGVRLRWFWGDVDHFIARCRDKESSLRDAVSAGTALLRGGRGAYGEVFRFGDFKPALRETIDWFLRR